MKKSEPLLTDEYSHRILNHHFSHTKIKLQQFAKHFDIVANGDMKGYGREALTGEFLSSHLPDQNEYLTGEIIDSDDKRSGQIDIIIQSKLYPKIPLWGNIHLAYSDSVMAAIEVKSNLTTQHLNTTLDLFRKVKSLKRKYSIKGSAKRIQMNAIPCVIFAYTGLNSETILNSISKYADANDITYDLFAPEVIVVLDKDYYIFKNDGWIFPMKGNDKYLTWSGDGNENLVGLYNYLNVLTQWYMMVQPKFGLGPYFKNGKEQ